MRRNIVAVLLSAAAIIGSGGAAALADPGPNGHNNFGLCKAYFAGSQNFNSHRSYSLKP